MNDYTSTSKRTWELRTKLSQPKHKAKKTHEQIERELSDYFKSGGSVEVLESFTSQPTRQVGVDWR